MTLTPPETTTTHPEVRPFSIDVPEEDLVDLRRRVAATRWPDRETVTDQSQACRWRRISSSACFLPRFGIESDHERPVSSGTRLL